MVASEIKQSIREAMEDIEQGNTEAGLRSLLELCDKVCPLVLYDIKLMSNDLIASLAQTATPETRSGVLILTEFASRGLSHYQHSRTPGTDGSGWPEKENNVGEVGAHTTEVPKPDKYEEFHKALHVILNTITDDAPDPNAILDYQSVMAVMCALLKAAPRGGVAHDVLTDHFHPVMEILFGHDDI